MISILAWLIISLIKTNTSSKPKTVSIYKSVEVLNIE